MLDEPKFFAAAVMKQWEEPLDSGTVECENALENKINGEILQLLTCQNGFLSSTCAV